MTLRFAAARSARRSPMARVLARVSPDVPLNDNDGARGTGVADDAVLHAALRHFAAHGLGAACAAQVQAERAFAAGDRPEYERWLGICRTLDRRRARNIARRNAPLLGKPTAGPGFREPT